jgi:hypothetical protein
VDGADDVEEAAGLGLPAPLRAPSARAPPEPFVAAPRTQAAALARGPGFVVEPSAVLPADRLALYDDLLGGGLGGGWLARFPCQPSWAGPQQAQPAAPGTGRDDVLRLGSVDEPMPAWARSALAAHAAHVAQSSSGTGGAAVALPLAAQPGAELGAGGGGADGPWALPLPVREGAGSPLLRGGPPGRLGPGGGELPAVPPCVVGATRLVVRRPAPVLRLPVVAAAQRVRGRDRPARQGEATCACGRCPVHAPAAS